MSPASPSRCGPWHPGAGDVVLVRLEGPERPQRPALVLSPPDLSARTGILLVCPIVDDPRGHPFEVPLPSMGRVSGVVLADRILSLDLERNSVGWFGSAASGVVPAVLERLLPLLVPAEGVEQVSSIMRAHARASLAASRRQV